jgi:hypothetical protein
MEGFDVVAPARMADSRWQMAAICNLQSAIHSVKARFDRVEHRHGY